MCSAMFNWGIEAFTISQSLLNNIEILPNSITKLLNLQTLILKKCLFLRELPKGINMLVSLKYLDITNCSKLTNMPLEIECLTSLEIVLP